jgi:hypothetical protein
MILQAYSRPLCKGNLAVVMAMWFFASCAPARFVKPLNKGQTAVSASLGGPLILFAGTTIPMPLTSVAVGHGFKNDLTGFAGLHTTALAFGVLQTDIGIVKELRKQKGLVPGVTVSPVANIMFDKWQGKFSFFPQLDVNAYWHYREKANYVYVGIGNWFDLNNKRSEGDAQQTHWLPAIQLGHTLEKHKWDYTLELKYIAPNHNNQRIVVDYQGIGHSGVIGVYIGVTRKF